MDGTGRHIFSDAWVTHALKEATSWVRQAGVNLTYDAPTTTLKVTCPDCGGRIRVANDATTDVWCAGLGVVQGPAQLGEPFPVHYGPCGATWPRHTWPYLLTRTNQAG